MKHNIRHRVWLKVSAVVLSVVLLISVLPFTIVYAADVDTEAELKSAINSNTDINLTADITLSASWTTADYSGNLSGNGHVITTSKTVFDDLSGSVKELGILTANTLTDPAVLANTSGGTIEGCFAYGHVNTTSDGIVGGLIGTMTGGTVKESFASVEIVADNASYVGGLIGKVEDGTVTDCYSAGSISVAYQDYNLCKIAGLANIENGKTPVVSNTYTSCQLRQPNTRAKASGVNGLYDNQMSIVREGYDNLGLSTRELMATKDLSDAFAVTGTAYPSLKRFYDSKWGDTADCVVRVSTAAVAFSDVDSSARKEPTDFAAHADYLTLNTYADRTNGFDLTWTLDAQAAKVLDTVPLTTVNAGVNSEAGAMGDLLRSKYEFAVADAKATLTVTSGNAERVWYLNIATQNPYFYQHSGTNDGTATGNPFWINSVQQLNAVRHYAVVGAYHYKLYANIACGDFDPIVDFTGNFNGNNKELQNLKLTNADGLSNVGLFATTRNNAAIRYITLKNATVTAQDGTAPIMGTLIGTAANSNVYRNLVSGSGTTLTNTATTGGLIGKAENTTVRDNLVSATIKGGNNCGGLVGEMSGSKKLYKCGSTGILIGGTNLGGLVGKATSVTVNDSYSTMAVLTDSTGAVNIGGLVGSNGGTVTTSYAASLVYSKNSDNGVGPLVGSGNAATSSYYEGEGSLLTEDMVGPEVMSSLAVTSSSDITNDTNGESWTWTKENGFMPQITYFVRTSRYSALSKVSTTPVYFQQYWNEAFAKNMTTGWITNTSGTVQFEKPATGIENFHEGNVNVYAVNNGWGFEADSSSPCVVLSFRQTNNIGIRAAGAVRPNMNTLSYTVQGTSGEDVYVELGYAASKDGAYAVSQTMHTVRQGGEKEGGTVMYDMPDAQYVRLKVITNDSRKIAFDVVTLSNGVTMNYDENTGYYTSAEPMTSIDGRFDTTVHIVLSANTPPWGLRQQNY